MSDYHELEAKDETIRKLQIQLGEKDRKIAQLGLSKDKIDLKSTVNKILESIQFMENFDRIQIDINVEEGHELISDQHNLEIVLNSKIIRYDEKLQPRNYVELPNAKENSVGFTNFVLNDNRSKE